MDEEPDRLQSMGLQRADMTEQLNMYTLKMQCFAEFCELLQQIIVPEEGIMATTDFVPNWTG